MPFKSLSQYSSCEIIPKVILSAAKDLGYCPMLSIFAEKDADLPPETGD
jgi:hypothetical protein